MKTKNFYKNLWTIALVLDFTSPKSTEILKGPLLPIQRFAVYPFETKTEANECKHVAEKFMSYEDLKKWTLSLSADSAPKNPAVQENAVPGEAKEDLANRRPLAAAIEKIRFDVQFHLHPIDQIIINVPEGDSCGEDVCKAIDHLENTLRQQGRKVQILAISALNCKLASNGPVTIQNVSKLTSSQVIDYAKKLAMAKPVEAETGAVASQMSPSASTSKAVPAKTPGSPSATGSSKTPKPTAVARAVPKNVPKNSPSNVGPGIPRSTPSSTATSTRPSVAPPSAPPSNPMTAPIFGAQPVTGAIELSGPPVKISFSPVEKSREHPITAHVPSSVNLTPGTWRMTIVSPSWAKDAPGLVIDLKANEVRKLNINKIFDDQVTWVESSKKDDLLFVFEQNGNTQHVLIPAGSPPMPVPKSLDWKEFPIPKESAVPSGSNAP